MCRMTTYKAPELLASTGSIQRYFERDTRAEDWLASATSQERNDVAVISQLLRVQIKFKAL